MKRIINCGFSYFINRDSYYEVLEGMVSFELMVKVLRSIKIFGN